MAMHLGRADLLALCDEFTEARRACSDGWSALVDRRGRVAPGLLADSQAGLHEAAMRLREACLACPGAAYAARRELLERQADGQARADAGRRACRTAPGRDEIRAAWNSARWAILCQRGALTCGLGWPHRGEWVTVDVPHRHDDSGPPVAGDGIYLHSNDTGEVGHVVWLPSLSAHHRDGHILIHWTTDPGTRTRPGPADPAGDIGIRLRDAPDQALPVPLMRWPGLADVGRHAPAGPEPPVPYAALFTAADFPGPMQPARQAAPAQRPRRVPAANPTTATLF